jgi:hypothetical protein
MVLSLALMISEELLRYLGGIIKGVRRNHIGIWEELLYFFRRVHDLLHELG